jgi:hypothetical protein
MKFRTGIALGFAAGYWVATMSDEQRRAKLDQMVSRVRDNPRVAKMAETVSRDARKVGDALEARVTSTADRAGDKVADTIEPHDETTTTSTTSTAATPGAQRSP